jgi:heme-degrading monooxygenase HmoA
VEGFLGTERFASEQEPGKYVAIGYFRDEAAVAAWRNSPAHRRAQALGRRLFLGRSLRSVRSGVAAAPLVIDRGHDG